MEEKQYNWFLIMCSWDGNADKDALEKFQWVYHYFNAYDSRDANDLRNAMDFASLKALDLIGQRKFVIIGRTTSNRVLQKISSNVTLETAIRVDVFPATYVHEFARLNIQRFDEIDGKTNQECLRPRGDSDKRKGGSAPFPDTNDPPFEITPA